jgi:HNH endonuclease
MGGHLHTHHIVHWAHGGATSADNLIRLCSHHHRLVHEGGYTITGHPGGELTFRRPNGRPLRQRLPRRGGCAESLTQLNRRHGTNPAATTITPDWNGVNLDLDHTITLLAHPVAGTVRRQEYAEPRERR